jgi:hypothetical protein
MVRAFIWTVCSSDPYIAASESFKRVLTSDFLVPATASNENERWKRCGEYVQGAISAVPLGE